MYIQGPPKLQLSLLANPVLVSGPLLQVLLRRSHKHSFLVNRNRPTQSAGIYAVDISKKHGVFVQEFHGMAFERHKDRQ
jgi:hypothetical protein